ncbi:SpaA isopeptide-forming pilin-related protein, partial [Acinetobacter baumannii]
MANGTYSFDNLRPGTYKVTEQTEPANTVNGKVTAGTIAGVPTGVAVNGPPSVINGVTLVATDSINNNFGEVANNAA